MKRETREAGFSLVELLVVVVIIGIIAAIGIPRLLSQRAAARDAAAISDLRALIAVETSLETTSGLSEDPGEIAATGWHVSDSQIVVCANVVDSTNIELTAWHRDGSNLYSWSRQSPRIVASDIGQPANCAGLGTAVS